MSTSLFRLYQDPENAGARGSHKLSTGGKSFVGGKQAGLGGTPRKALVDINTDPAHIQRDTTGTEFKKPAIPPTPNSQSGPHRAPRINEILKPPKEHVTVSAAEAPSVCPYINDDIEHMQPGDNDIDDFEDILPKAERISTYLSRLISWRPTCLADRSGSDGESDNDDGFEYLDRLSEQLDSSNDIHSWYTGDSDLEINPVLSPGVPLPSLEEITLDDVLLDDSLSVDSQPVVSIDDTTTISRT